MIHFSTYLTKAFNEKKHVLAIFCDLRKAFDTVNHKILIKKLFNCGIRGLELDWFKNYLTNRNQFVVINDEKSHLCPIRIGVPQGSVLGPLLFLLYINDLPDASLLYALLFADDTTLLNSDTNLQTLFENTNAEFYKITTFFRKNKLSLNPIKTKFILFSTNRNIHKLAENLQIICNDNNLNTSQNPSLIHSVSKVPDNQDTPAIKFLGLYIDPLFNFKYHIHMISKKINSALYFMRTAKNVLNKKASTSLYYTLIHSHLIYAIHLWSTSDKNSINGLFKLQKKAIRIIHNLSYNCHTESYFKLSKILPLPRLIEFHKLQFMQNYSQGFLPISFNSVWTTNAERAATTRPYLLRNDSELYLPAARLALTSKHPYHSFPKAWSEFHEYDIKIQRDKKVFNTMLKNHFLNQLESNFKCNRLLCPHCHLSPPPLPSLPHPHSPPDPLAIK